MNQDHKKLHEKFSALGRERNRLTYELLAMLPQIYIEGVYREHRCATIYEYAGKYAGLSHSVVEKTLKLHRELKGKPFLREAIRTQGVHKVALVAKIATAETDEVLAKRVVDMSKPALIELSKELRQKVEVHQVTIEQIAGHVCEGEAEGGSFANPNLCHAAQESMTISLDPEMQFLFLKLKKRFEKKESVNLSNKQGLKLMLEELSGRANSGKSRKAGIPNVGEGKSVSGEIADRVTGDKIKSGIRQRKMNAVKNFPGKKMDGSAKLLRDNIARMSGDENNSPERMDVENEEIMQCVNDVRAGMKKIDTDIFKRYIPMKIRRLAIAKTTGGCAYPGCHRPYENFHHRARFGDGGTHDSIVPVCRAHHEFAHNGLVWRELADVREWELDLVESGSLDFADKRCGERRMEARNGG